MERAKLRDGFLRQLWRLNKLDVIADDKKLIEIYVAIVKEMAVKHGVTLESA